ncbi:type II toxin-antitoxin system RelE/ParE family toxin [Mesorhizobium sp. M1338]|uniref:type II toxin-antitoxin system RelE/ParE family toxin n=1 Tax=unclassified Mesorhizobium TaxID=325217 RepID=UPI00333A28BF
MEIRQTKVYAKWYGDLPNAARGRIDARIFRVRHTGHFGDTKPVGESVSEMRVDHGPGYRIYFACHGDAVVLLLCGGDKGSQRRDIARAKKLAQEYFE